MDLPRNLILMYSRIDLESGAQTVVSTHAQGVRNILYSAALNLLISASWDSTLHLHDLNNPGDFSAISLPSKPFSLSASATKLVVAMASRAVNIYELDALSSAAKQGGGEAVNVEPWQRRESSMKYMTRAVSCMPNDAGYSSSSIEGRVAVEWFDPSEESQSRKYAFKCHRQNVDGHTSPAMTRWVELGHSGRPSGCRRPSLRSLPP